MSQPIVNQAAAPHKATGFALLQGPADGRAGLIAAKGEVSTRGQGWSQKR